MEEKYLTILTEILSNPSITRKELEDKLALTKDQIRYAIKKINAYLVEKELPSIQRTKNGCFLIDPSVSSVFLETDKNEAVSNMFYSQEERIIILSLLLFNESIDLSLEYFSYEIGVSKNTILRDLTKLKKTLNKYSLQISYSRIHGYSIFGNELLIRDFIKATLFKIIKMSNGSQLLVEFSQVTHAEKTDLEQNLRTIEAKLEINFTDEQYQMLPYFLTLLFKRIGYGKKVKNQRLEDEFAILNLYEVKVIAAVMHLKQYGKGDMIYISLQTLSSNISSGEFISDTITTKLRTVLQFCIDNLEIKIAIELKDKESLLNSLMYHLTPAYFRMKYLINEKNDLYEAEFFDNVIAQYDFLNSIVKECFKPLEEFLEVPLPEVEIMYISLIIGSKILPQGKSEYPKMKTAIVICPKGVTYSQLMLSQLMAIFPEVYFYEPVSHRAFQKSHLQVDIIFSIGHFYGYENCFVVHATMSDHEKQQLRTNVFKKIFGVEGPFNIVERIMDEIAVYVPKEAQTVLKKRILHIVGENQLADLPATYEKGSGLIRLSDFLSPERVVLLDSVKDYQEAIQLAAVPLLKEGAVTKQYIQSAITSHKFDDPYIILGDHVAIPHALPEEGVKKIAISLLIVREGVYFSKNQKIQIIFFLAPVDKKQHNQAIVDILSVAESIECVHSLLIASNKQEVLRLIEKNMK